MGNETIYWDGLIYAVAEIDLGTKEVFTIDHGTYAPSTEVEERV